MSMFGLSKWYSPFNFHLQTTIQTIMAKTNNPFIEVAIYFASTKVPPENPNYDSFNYESPK